MTAITFLGTGRVATTLGTGLARVGHTITFGSRGGAASTLDVEGARTTDPAAAVAASPVVVNATPGETSLERLTGLRDALAGKVLVDVSNAVHHGEDGMPGELVHAPSSLAEQLQAALPDTAVVKTLNTMLFPVMTDPGSLSAPATAFLSGDDAGAKDAVRALLHDLGWSDKQILDLGGVRTARGPEAMILLVPDVLRARGFTPFAVSVAT